MREIKSYWIDNVPTVEDLEECCKVAAYESCVVRLEWEVVGCRYMVHVDENSVPVEVYERYVPKVYGV